MKQNLKKILLLAPLLLLASITSATYSPPTAAPTEGNTIPPIDVSAANQVKDGGLSVNAFNVAGNARFKENVFVGGAVRGGSTASAGDTTIAFGTKDATVGFGVTGPLLVSGAISSPVLAHASGTICSDKSGMIVTCEQKAPQPLIVSVEYHRLKADGAYAKSLTSLSVRNIDADRDYTIKRSATTDASDEWVDIGTGTSFPSGVYEIADIRAVCGGSIYFDGTQKNPIGYQFVLDENNPDQPIIIRCVN